MEATKKRPRPVAGRAAPNSEGMPLVRAPLTAIGDVGRRCRRGRTAASTVILLLFLLSASHQGSHGLGVNGLRGSGLFCQSNRHVHLSVGYDAATSMTVSFSSGPCDLGLDPPPRAGIRLGTHPDRLDRLVLEQIAPKRYNSTVHLHRHIDYEEYVDYVSEYQRHVTVEGLQPDTVYYYRPITLKAGGGLEPAGKFGGGTRPEVRINEDEDLLRKKQMEEEVARDDGEEENMRRRTRKGVRTSIGTRPGKRLGEGRQLNLNPHQTQKFIERAVKDKKRKRAKGNAQPCAPSFRTAPKHVSTNSSESRSAPASGSASGSAFETPTPVKFAIIGDVAQTVPSIETLEHLNPHIKNISAIILVGDIAYANGYHDLWDTWFDMTDMFSKAFHHRPLQVIPGNHEIERDREGRIFQSYEARFHMPQIKPMVGGYYEKSISNERIVYPIPYDYGNAFYGFKYGPSHHIMLNSFTDFTPGSSQYEWLVKELGEVNRNATPWLLVSIHCPMYNTFKWHRHDEQSLLALKYLEPLFVEHRVNFVLSGHLHAYMRTNPVSKGRTDPKGPIHVILGNGGRQANTPYHMETPEEWVAVRDHTTYGYGTIELLNATHARYEWVQTDYNKVSTFKAQVREDEVGRAKDRGIIDQVYIKNQLYR